MKFASAATISANDIRVRHSASESPSVASASVARRRSVAWKSERQLLSEPCSSYTAPVGWCTISARSANTVRMASASRARIAASARAAFAVAAFGRTRRADALGLDRELSKRASAWSAWSDVELLEAGHEAVCAEDPEHEVVALERAAGRAVDAGVNVTNQEGVGAQTDDVVDADHELRREVDERADARVRTASFPRTDPTPTVRWSIHSTSTAKAVA